MAIRVKPPKATVASWATFYQIFMDNVVAPFKTALKNWRNAVIGSAPGIISDAAKDLQPITDTIKLVFEDTGKAMAAGLDPTFGALAQEVFNAATVNLTAAGESTPDAALAEAGKAYAQAFGFGMSSAATTAIFELLMPEKLNVLNGVGPMLAKMAGFDEVAAAVRDPLYENAFGQALKYHFKSIFKPEFADEGDAVQWHSRRLLSEEDLREVFKYSGLKAKYEEAYVNSAYRAIQPRALASLVQDVVFPTADMTALLEFAGIRDADIARLLPLMEENSLKNVRNEYLSAVTRAAEMGTIDDPTLDGHLDSLNFSDKAKNFVHLTVAVKRLEQLAELYRRSVTALYETNQMDDSQYVPALQAIGINDADANAHFAIDSARKKGRELLKEERAAAREQGRQTSLAVQTARTEYFAGTLDDVAFSAAITASGLPADLIPGTIALGVAQKSARRVEKYGLLLDRHQAQLLTEKVAALKEQVVKKLTPIDAASQTLDSFGIPAANRNALLSDWSAQALKTVLPV
jgi:hypothetical protein